MDNSVLREYSPQDQADVIDLWKSCGLVVPWNDPARDIELKLQVDPDLFLVTENKGTVTGTIMGGYEGHRGWIYYLAVHPDHRNLGIGRRMIEEVEKRLAQRGCPKINLMVRRSNSTVIDFYTSLGYLKDDVVCLGKKLKPQT